MGYIFFHFENSMSYIILNFLCLILTLIIKNSFLFQLNFCLFLRRLFMEQTFLKAINLFASIFFYGKISSFQSIIQYCLKSFMEDNTRNVTVSTTENAFNSKYILWEKVKVHMHNQLHSESFVNIAKWIEAFSITYDNDITYIYMKRSIAIVII